MKKSDLAKKYGYTLAGEAYAMAAILFKRGNIKGAYEAMIQSLSCDDTAELAVSLQEINQNALEEAGLIEREDEDIKENEEDEDDDDEVNEILSAFENISNFLEESGDEDDDDEEEEEEDDDDDCDDDDDDEDDEEEMEVDEDEEEASEFDEPYTEENNDDDDFDPMIQKSNSYSNNERRNRLAAAIANKASLGQKPKR